MHILDVISSVSRSSKFIKVVGGWGFALDPTGEFTITSLVIVSSPTFQERGQEGKGGAKMIYAPWALKTLAPSLVK